MSFTKALITYMLAFFLPIWSANAQDNLRTKGDENQAFLPFGVLESEFLIKQHKEKILTQNSIHKTVPPIRVTKDGQTHDIVRFHYKLIIEKSSSLESFIKDIALELSSISQKTQWEFCGFVSFHDHTKEYAIEITTTKSSLFCLPTSYQKDGFYSTNAMVHTHPPQKVVTATELEKWVIGSSSSLIWLEPEGLSPQDLQHPHTWLITPNNDILHALPSNPSHSHLSIGVLCPFKDLLL